MQSLSAKTKPVASSAGNVNDAGLDEMASRQSRISVASRKIVSVVTGGIVRPTAPRKPVPPVGVKPAATSSFATASAQ